MSYVGAAWASDVDLCVPPWTLSGLTAGYVSLSESCRFRTNVLYIYIYKGSSRYRSFLHQLICHVNFVGVPLSVEAMPVKVPL